MEVGFCLCSCGSLPLFPGDGLERGADQGELNSRNIAEICFPGQVFYDR